MLFGVQYSGAYKFSDHLNSTWHKFGLIFGPVFKEPFKKWINVFSYQYVKSEIQ